MTELSLNPQKIDQLKQTLGTEFRIKLLVACDQKNGIGIDNGLPWHLPNDLKFFKQKTTQQVIVMGRNTYESIGKPLPNRCNIVVSSNLEFQKKIKETYVENACTVVSNLADAFVLASKKTTNQSVYVIGGGSIYHQTIDLATDLYVTQVETTVKADCFFPSIDMGMWDIKSTEPYTKDERHAYNFAFVHYTRRQ